MALMGAQAGNDNGIWSLDDMRCGIETGGSQDRNDPVWSKRLLKTSGMAFR
jgi:hypothetical protein